MTREYALEHLVPLVGVVGLIWRSGTSPIGDAHRRSGAAALADRHLRQALWKGMTGGKLGFDFMTDGCSAPALADRRSRPPSAFRSASCSARSERLYRSLEFVIDFFRSTPASAMFPLFLVLFGVGDKTKI